jgi:hypothetical protein
MSARHTIVAHGLLVKHDLRVEAARGRLHGRQIMTFEALACRLAGGFIRAIDDESLRDSIQKSLPEVELGELDAIKELPGLVDAAAGTLRKAWRSGIDLQAKASDHPRIASIAKLEGAVLGRLPSSMMKPADLVAKGMRRIQHAETIFGRIRIVGITELSPCWRPLLHALAEQMPVTWVAGPRQVPPWLDGKIVEIERSEAERPEVTSISAATAYHEAIEAMRWARELLASGVAKPNEIGMASAIPAEYDDHFLALRADANLDLHFVHGVKVPATRDGQAAAALADILVRGLSQTRMRRLASLAKGLGGVFEALPDRWMRMLPSDAPLASADAWARLLAGLTAANWPDGKDHADDLRGIVALLDKGTSAAAAAGEKILGGQALKIWRKALLAGPAASIDATIGALKLGDGLEGSVCTAWMPASELAASPRRFVRLLGLNSGRWPRGPSEDRLLSDHVIPTPELDPLPVAAADRRDFETILAATARQVVLSRSRRDSEGRLLGRSPLLRGRPSETYVRRNAIPPHAFSETDRLLARTEEFADTHQSISAAACWGDWHRPELTPHDGLVPPGHPAVLAILDRLQSASSLKALLRNPLGFVWRYGLHLRAPESGSDPLVLDPPDFGDLVHAILEIALRSIEASGSLASATSAQIVTAIDAAAGEAANRWKATQATPPALIWNRTLTEARRLSERALDYRDSAVPDARSYCEVPFGGSEPKSAAAAPWDFKKPVEIPGTGFRIAGYIDRLDISADHRQALVRDYKTGRTPEGAIVLDGGKELQRCLYAFAVKALLGEAIEVSASLFFPRDLTDLRLETPEATLAELSKYLRLARDNLAGGGAVMGPDTGDKYDDLAFALPANPKAIYRRRKELAATERLGEATSIWVAG